MLRLADEDLATLERLEKAATPGPWDTERNFPFVSAGGSEGVHWLDYESPCDKEFVVVMRNALPAILAEVRKYRQRDAAELAFWNDPARKERRAWQEALRRMHDEGPEI